MRRRLRQVEAEVLVWSAGVADCLVAGSCCSRVELRKVAL